MNVKTILIAVAALALVTGNIKASTLANEFAIATGEANIIDQEIIRASQAFTNHEPNWIALTELAVHNEQALITKTRLLIARARLDRTFSKAVIDRTEKDIDLLESNMNTTIAGLARLGVRID